MKFSCRSSGRSLLRLLATLTLLLTCANLADAATRVIRVKKGATFITATTNGQTWAHAYDELWRALEGARLLGPTQADPVEIWMTEGTFTPDDYFGIPNSAINLLSWVSVHGGFSLSAPEASLAARNPATPMTVLSGDVNNNHALVEPTSRAEALNAVAPDITDANFKNNSRNVLRAVNVVGARLERLVITGGYASRLNDHTAKQVEQMLLPDPANLTTSGSMTALSPKVAGGGIYVENVTSSNGVPNLTLTDCVITQNYVEGAGGGMAVVRAKVEVNNSLFVANHSALAGGAYFGRDQFVTFNRSDFIRNTSALSGGAVALESPVHVPGNWKDNTRSFVLGSDPKTYQQVVANAIVATKLGVGFDPALATNPGTTAIRELMASRNKAFDRKTKTISLAGMGLEKSAAAGPYGYVIKFFKALGIAAEAARAAGAKDEVTEFIVDDLVPNFERYATPNGLSALAVEAIFKEVDPASLQPRRSHLKDAFAYMTNQAAYSSFNDCHFTANQAVYNASAIDALRDNVKIDRSLFRENYAGNSGTVAARGFSLLDVNNSIFSGNSGEIHSGITIAVHVFARLTNCTLVNNVSVEPNGYAFAVDLGAEGRIINSVLWGNTNGSPINTTGGADIFTATYDNLDTDTAELFRTSHASWFRFIGVTEIANSNVQGLSQLVQSWDKTHVDPLTDPNYIAQRETGLINRLYMLDFAEAESAHDQWSFVIDGQGNRFLDRGNFSVDPLFHTGYLPGYGSPILSGGSFDRYNTIYRLPGTTDFFGQPRYRGQVIGIGAVANASTPVDTGVGGEAPGRYFVRPVATGDGTGRNWANASSDLKTMLAKTNAEVWVLAGTYYPSATGVRTEAFTLGLGTQAFGGFEGTEVSRNERNFTANVTILSGNLAAKSPGASPSYHVVKNSKVVVGDKTFTNANGVLDGFTITGGDANGADGNGHGGGIYHDQSEVALRNLIVTNNRASGSGGGFYSNSNQTSELTHCRFRSNTATRGGAVYAQGYFDSEACEFTDNQATQFGGAILLERTLFASAVSQAMISNSVFSNNRSTASGSGSAFYASHFDTTILNSTFSGNRGFENAAGLQYGSAVYVIHGSFDLQNSILYGNRDPGLAAPSFPIELSQFYLPLESQSTSPATYRNNLIQGFRTSVAPTPRNESGNFDAPPQFVDAANGNLRPTATSPFLDRGTGSVDLLRSADADGHARKFGSQIDPGAYEFQGTSQVLAGLVTIARTLNEDGPTYTFRFLADNAPAGATYTWLVNKNDGRGFMPLPEDARITGQGTTTLTLAQPPAEWDQWTFRMDVGGTASGTAAKVLVNIGTDRVYVNGAVATSGNGKTWATAYKTLQEANQATLASDYTQIWVAQGTYVPDRTGPGSVFAFYPGRVVYGGFNGTETAASQRNFALYPTILDGAQPGAKDVLEDALDLVLFGPNSNASTPAILDGFTLRNARRNAINVASGSPLITRCVIENERGAGVLSNATPTFRDVLFRKNPDGAVRVSSGLATFEKVLFTQNTGPDGAAIRVDSNAAIVVRQSTFADNFAHGRAGGIHVSTNATATIERSIFWGNRDASTELGGPFEPAQIYSRGTVALSNSLVEALTTYTTGGNLGEHPLFIDPLNQNYTLAAQSPAIALQAGALAYSGTPAPTLRFTSLPNSSEERTSLVAKTFTATWQAGAGHVLRWEIDLGQGWVNPATTSYAVSTNASATGSEFTITTSGAALASLRVRAITANQVALPAVSLKVIPPTIRYVAKTGPATGANGLSWATAYRTVEEAMDNLPSLNTEIWIARGSYESATSVTLIPGVVFFGGFAGTETSIGQRVASPANVTTLRGAFIINKLESTYVGKNNLRVERRLFSRQLVMEGIRLDSSTTTGNGTALYLRQGGGVFRNCEFIRSVATSAGNGTELVKSQGGTTLFENCSFNGNTSAAAIVVQSGSPVFRSCRFEDNRGNSEGGAFKLTGGNTLIDRATFTNNRATDSGGAIYGSLNNGDSVTITNSLFTGNQATQGGAIFSNGMTLVNCTLTDNRASREGGGLYTYGTVTVLNSIIWSNRAAPDLYNSPNAIERAQLTVNSGATTVKNSIVEGLASFTGNNNLPYHPLFAGTAPNPYALAPNSPAIDRAVLVDLDAVSPVLGYPGRLSGTALDLGAYEFSGAAKPPIQLTSAPTSAAVYNGANQSFTVTGAAGTGANVVWEKFDGTNWVVVSGAAFKVTTNSTSSTLTITNIADAHGGLYRYRIGSLNYTSVSFNVAVTTRRIVYVDSNAAPGGNGASWGTAFKGLNEAAALTDTVLEVRVAAGFYTPAFINMRGGILFRGGYPATGSAAERNVANPTVNRTQIDGTAIVYADATAADFTLETGYDGFQLVPGSGGVRVVRGARVFFRNCVITAVTSSPAFLIENTGSVDFDNCTFKQNAPSVLVSLKQNSSARIVRATVSDNTGCIFLNVERGSFFAIEASTFSNNSNPNRNDPLIKFDTTLTTNVSTITRSRFLGNSGEDIIHAFAGPLEVSDSLLLNNTNAFVRGSGKVTVRHITAYNNQVSVRPDSTQSRALIQVSELDLSNSILWANRSAGSSRSIEAQQLDPTNNTLTLRSNLIEGFATLGGTGNLDNDPLFLNASLSQFELSPYSPAINSGLGTSSSPIDLFGTVRNGAPDRGAIEFTGTPATPIHLTSAPISIPAYLRSAVSFTVVSDNAASNVVWWRWNGSAWVLVAGNDPRLIITANGNSSVLTLSNVATPDAAEKFSFTLANAAGFRSAPVQVFPTVRPRRYVGTGTTPPYDGTSWANAAWNFVSVYNSAPEGAEIWVQAGSYSGQYPTLRQGIEVYGGFTSPTATSTSQRDLTGELTVLRMQMIGRSVDRATLLDGVTIVGSGYTGLHLYDNASPTLRRVVFRDSSNGLSVSSGHPLIEDSVFRGNTRAGLEMSSGNVTLKRANFSGSGTAIITSGGVLAVSDSLFHDHTLGDALLVSVSKTADVTFDRVTVRDNFGDSLITVFGGKLTLRNSLLVDNTPSYYGLLNVADGELNVLQSTIYGNSGTAGNGGLNLRGGATTVKNSILWNNTGRPYGGGAATVEQNQLTVTGGTLSIGHSIVQGLATYTGNGNFADAPLFTDAGLDDFTLSAVSPAINAGDATLNQTGYSLDRAGLARVVGSAPDLGAHEFAGTPGTPLRILRSPASLEVAAGDTASFIAESASAGPFTWQRETAPGVWTTITSGGLYVITVNGNTSTLAVGPATFAAHHGQRFRFQFGGTTSAPFSLSVVDKRIIYVNPSATGTPADGTTWSRAFRTLEDAFFNWSTGAEIWAARTSIRLEETLVLPEGMKLYGGFSGNEATLEQRTPGAQTALTILFANSAAWRFVDQTGTNSTRATVLDGFTFSGANDKHGIVLDRASLTVRNCDFRDFSQTVVNNNSSAPLFENCFFGNSSFAVFNELNSSSEIVGCTFEDNNRSRSNASGSALLKNGNLAGQPTLVRDSLFRRNFHAATYVQGDSAVVFERCRWLENSNQDSAALAVTPGATVTVRDSLFADNTAIAASGRSHAIIINAGTLSLLNVTVAGNRTHVWNIGSKKAAAVENGGTLTVTNSIIADNTTVGDTAGLTTEQLQLYSGPGWPLTVSHSLISGLQSITGTGNLGSEVLFDPAYSREYRLSIFSPAVNAGYTAASTALRDLLGQTRVVGAAIDLGATELAETVGVTPLTINPTSSADNIVPVWSTAAGHLSITGSPAALATIYWEILVNGQWVAIPAGGDFTAAVNGNTATLTIASPASDTIPDRRVRFGFRGMGYVSSEYTVTTNGSNLRYVKGNAAANGDGLSWRTAFRTVAEAVAAAPAHTEIWIAEGYYDETTPITLPPAIRLYGGFSGDAVNVRSRATRLPTQLLNPFILPSTGSPDAVLFDSLTLRNNSVTLTNRSALFRNVRFEEGSGVIVSGTAPSVLFEDTSFVNNSSAISGRIDAATLRRTFFFGNTVAVTAAGSTWTIEDSYFDSPNNSANPHAPHFLDSTVTTLTVRRSTFLNSTGRIAPVRAIATAGTAEFTDVNFFSNTSTDSGASALTLSGFNSAVFQRSTFLNNTGVGAGALSATNSDLDLRQSYFVGNQSSGSTLSGAILLTGSTFEAVNITVANNRANNQSGGGIVAVNSTGSIVNSILYGNNAGSGTIEDRQLRATNSTVTTHHSLIEGLNAFAGAGMIGYNPRFITINDRLAPGPNSPALNAGDNTALIASEVDLLGAPRINATNVDLGAIEPTTLATATLLDLALIRRVPGGYLEITFDNTRGYTGLTWQFNNGSGWQTLALDPGAFVTNGNFVTLRLPWSPELYEGANIRLVGTDYISTTLPIAYGNAPAAQGAIVAITPASGSTATSLRPDITVTFNQAQTGLDLNKLVVHGSLHGRLATVANWGTVTTDPLTPVLLPGINFNAGEIVEVSATAAIGTALGNNFKPYVARFAALWLGNVGKFRRGDTLTTGTNISGVAAGDLNADGFGDVMFASAEGAWIYLGDGDGQFHRLNYGTGGEWNAFAIADFNGDGRNDFIGSRQGASLTVETLNASSDATTNLLTAPLAFAGRRLLSGDFNGDGRQDVLVLGASTTDGEVLLLNQGNGTFAPAGTQRFAPADDRTREAAVADLNRDGTLDFVQVRATTGDIVVWMNDGTGVFTSATTIRIPNTQTIALTDIDQDGWTDLAIAGGSGTDTLHIYRNDQAGNLVHVRSFAAGAVVQLAAADFDGNSATDLLAITGTANDVLWKNTGAGAFTASPLTWTSNGATASAQLAIADLNRDGTADVILPQSSRILFWTSGSYFTGFSRTVNESTTLAFTRTDFTDVTTTYGGSATDRFLMTELPKHGVVKLDNFALPLYYAVSLAQLSQLTYTPTSGYDGPDSFRMAPQFYDGTHRDPKTAGSAKISISVVRTVTAPTTNAQTVQVFKNRARSFQLAGTHPEGEFITFAITRQPAHGDIALSDTQTLINREALYTPDTDYTGNDSFDFSVTDAFGGITTGTVSLNISDKIHVVTTTAASGAGSLSQALTTAIADGVGRVVIDASLANQSIELSTATDTVHGPTAYLVAGYLEIDAEGATQFSIKRSAGTANLRLFRVASTGHLVFNGLTLTDGRIQSENAGTPARGAAIYNEGTLETNHANFSNHTAQGLTSTGAQGGAIYSSNGVLLLSETNIANNTAQDASSQGEGGGIFLRNGSARLELPGIGSNTAPTAASGADMHVLADNAAASVTLVRGVFPASYRVSRLGTGQASTINQSNTATAPTTLPLSISAIANLTTAIVEATTLPLTLTSSTAAVTVSTRDAYFYLETLDGNGQPEREANLHGLPGIELLGSGTSRSVRFTPKENVRGYATVRVTASENGISYAEEFGLPFISTVFVAPTVQDKEVYSFNGAAVAVDITATHPLGLTILYEIVTAPMHGTLTGTAPNLTYTPASGYRGNDYLVYRASTSQGLGASARVLLRSTSANVSVTSAETSGTGSLADALRFTPALPGVTWTLTFDSALAGKTIDTSLFATMTAAGPSAYVINSNVVLDCTAAPGLIISRPDNADPMRLFYVAPSASLTLKNLTLDNGAAVAHGGQPARGGAIYLEGANLSQSSLALDHITLANNSASGVNGQGGAIYANNTPGVSLDAVTFLANTAGITNTGATGTGGSIYARNTLVEFTGNTGSTFAGGRAEFGKDVALVADAAPASVLFFRTSTDGLFVDRLNNGTTKITAYGNAAVTGPGLLHIAPVANREASIHRTTNIALSVVNGPAESMAYDSLTPFIDNSELGLDDAATANPTLRITPNPANINAGGEVNVAAISHGGDYRFERVVGLAITEYDGPVARNETYAVNANEPFSAALPVELNPLFSVTYQFEPALIDQSSNVALLGESGGSITEDTGNFVFTPRTDFVGRVKVPYSVTDSHGTVSSATLYFQISAGQPRAEPQTAVVQIDTPTAVMVFGQHTIPGLTLTYSLGTTPPQHGTVTQTGDQEFTYTPDSSYAGNDLFNFKATDRFGQESSANVSVIVADFNANTEPTITGFKDPAPILFQPGGSDYLFSDVIVDDDTIDQPITISLWDPSPYGHYVFPPVPPPPPGGTATDPWVRDDFGAYRTTGTKEEVTTRLRAVNFIVDTPLESMSESLEAWLIVIAEDPLESSFNLVPVNILFPWDAPIASDLALETLPATPVSFTLSATQPQGQPLTFTLTSPEIAPERGTLTHDGLDYTFTPAPGFHGTEDFVWSITAPNARSTTHHVRITVNTPPAGTDDLVIRDDSLQTIPTATLLANDTDADTDALTITEVASTSAHGVAVTLNGSVITYAASASLADDSFTYTLRDSFGATATATVNLQFINLTPVAVDDHLEREFGQPFETNAGVLLANDSDVDADGIFLVSVDATSVQGMPITLIDGTLRYTPTANFAGVDSFEYMMRDGRNATATARVHLTLANRPPIAADLTLSRTNDQPATVSIAALIAASSDPDDDELSLLSFEGTSALGATISISEDSLTYTASSQTAIADEDYFLYTLHDNRGGTATGAITVQLLNRAPVAAAHNVGRFNTDAASIIPIANLVAGATDADLDLVTFDSVSALSTAGATLTVVGTDVVYTPASLPLNVEDTFTYTVKDPRGAIATGTVTMKLVNRAPVAGTNHVINRYNTEPGTIDVDTLLGSATDADGDTVTFVATSATSAQNATISVSAGVVTYTAAPLAITGDDTFTYTITDSRVATPVTGTVTVKLVNRAPLAGATIIQRHNDEPATITTAALINAASDPDSDPLTFVAAATTSAQGATISVNAGLITYTAASPTAIVGDDTFTYTITDSRVATPVTGTVTVKLLNRAPVGAADSVNRAAGEALSVSAATLLGNDSDADGDVITITAVSGTSAQGVPVVLTGTTITYTPNAAITGTDTFTYTVRDSKGLASEPVTVTVATTAPTTAPTLTVSNRAGGGAALQLKGVAFTSYVISVSTDLVTWTPLTTVTTNAQGLATAEDTTAPSDGAGRFYQADHN
ncbi:Ig-like domain-containing protein [Oleiharenicola lentus]|uniref:Ig-like domain-containing protein n=1 Tax=Oleiharenicola lentus TaxID=2508720 RepID=UPI003F669FF2